MLVSLQILSFVAEYLIDAYHVESDDLLTYFYIIFSATFLFLVIAPWAKVKIVKIDVKNVGFDRFFEKWLIPTLLFMFTINLVLAVIIMIMVPDISEYKLKGEWKELYDSIPMFALLNRVSYITQYMGYFAVPISFSYFASRNNKKGTLFLFLSTSSFMSGVAAYSRAQMLTYAMCVLASFFLFQKIFSEAKRKIIKKYTLRAIVIIGAIFLVTTFMRFSADNMAYYGERIPKTSKIQDPIVYSIFDYTGQGFPTGINLLVKYSPSKSFNGQNLFYYPLLFLDYFGIISWDSWAFDDVIDKVYGERSVNFHGSANDLVYNFGIISTLIIGLIYYAYTRRKVAKLSKVSMTDSFILTYLCIEPTLSIFYSGLGIMVFPFAYFVLIKFLYNLKCSLKVLGR